MPRASLHKVSKTVMHSHAAHLSWQCWQSSLLFSCRLAETDPLRGNIEQLVPRSLQMGTHQEQSSTAGTQLFMAKSSPASHGARFTTTVKNQRVPPMLPDCSCSTLGAGAAMEQPWGASGTSDRVKNTSVSSISGCGSMCKAKQRAYTARCRGVASCICKPQNIQF